MALQSPKSRQVQSDTPFFSDRAAATEADELQVVLLRVVLSERLIDGEPGYLVRQDRALSHGENPGFGPWIKRQVGGVTTREDVGVADGLKRPTHGNESVVQGKPCPGQPGLWAGARREGHEACRDMFARCETEATLVGICNSFACEYCYASPL